MRQNLKKISNISAGQALNELYSSIKDDYVLPNFRRSELADKATGIVKIADGTGVKLQALRDAVYQKTGYGLIITSGCRHPAYNQYLRSHNAAAHPRSLHMFDNPHHKCDTCAFDISIRNRDRLYVDTLIDHARNADWSIIRYNSWIHIDDRTRVLGLNRYERI